MKMIDDQDLYQIYTNDKQIIIAKASEICLSKHEYFTEILLMSELFLDSKQDVKKFLVENINKTWCFIDGDKQIFF